MICSLGFRGGEFSDLASWKLTLKPVRIRRKRSTRTINQIMTERAHINDEELSYFSFRHRHYIKPDRIKFDAALAPGSSLILNLRNS